MKKNFLLISVIISQSFLNAQKPISPSFEDIISLRSVSNAVISPDGNNLVFESSTTDWKETGMTGNCGFQKTEINQFS